MEHPDSKWGADFHARSDSNGIFWLPRIKSKEYAAKRNRGSRPMKQEIKIGVARLPGQFKPVLGCADSSCDPKKEQRYGASLGHYWLGQSFAVPTLRSAHNNQVILIARGWHVARLRERHASSLRTCPYGPGPSAVLRTGPSAMLRTSPSAMLRTRLVASDGSRMIVFAGSISSHAL